MEAEFIPRRRDRLVTRVLVLVALPLAAFLVVVIAVNARRTFVNLREAGERDLRAAVTLAAARIEDLNNDAAVAARTLADVQAEGLLGDREHVLSLMGRMLRGAPRFNGLFCVYEPDADGADEAVPGPLPAEALADGGRFAPYLHRGAGRGDELVVEPNVDMESSLYYQGVKDAFAASGRAATMVTEPYVYRGTGKMLVEFSHPIVIEDRFVGVAGVDVILEDVGRRLRELAATHEVDALLISAAGNLVATAAGDDTLATRPISELAEGPILDRLHRSTSDVVLELEAVPPGDARHYFAAARIGTGGWLLVLRQHERDVLAPIWAQVHRSLLLAAAALIVVITTLIGTSVRVGRRVQRAAEAAGRVARGDLTTRVEPGRGRDEAGLLLRAIGRMTDSLNTLVGNVRHASITLHSSATELAATSRAQEETAASFGSAASEVAAATAQISATGDELVRTMSGVSRRAGEATELATEGRSSLHEMDETMRGLEAATGAIGARLGAIHEKAGEITGVVTTISKVADQTNLLSVNAAIEAEKAGAAGSGFLVVAGEIRRLADRTAASTLDITASVEQMQSVVSEGVTEMDRFASAVRTSADNVADVTRRMERIIEQVAANTDSFTQVNEGMRSQSEGAAQIATAMRQLTENASHTTEAIGEYAAAAADLQTAIATLKTSIASFRLRSRDPSARLAAPE